MKLKDLYEEQMEKAADGEDLLASIENGRFTKDGSHLRVGDFSCSNNQLTSLEGVPAHVGGYFYCNNNQLTSLEGAPDYVGGYFWCSDNQLTSLEGAPDYVGGDFSCRRNQLTSLEGAPDYVGGDFSCRQNRLTSLKDVHKHVKEISGTFFCKRNPIKSHVLGLLLIPGITAVEHDVFGQVLTAAIEQYPGDDQKSLKQRLMYASRRLIDELDENGKELAQL